MIEAKTIKKTTALVRAFCAVNIAVVVGTAHVCLAQVSTTPPQASPARPTARQYDLARSAVQAAIAEQKNKVLQASAYLKNPNLKEYGTNSIATGLAEIKRLENLLQQTTQCANRGYPLPMAAIDLAVSATAAQSSKALAARDFQALSRTAQDITGLIELQKGAPSIPSVQPPARNAQPAAIVRSAVTPVPPPIRIPTPVYQAPAQPVRAPASIQTTR